MMEKGKRYTAYVAGFYFEQRDDGISVALIRKDHPEWQAGKLNGIGGKVKEGEYIKDTMRREFAEEASKEVRDWDLVCSLKGQDYIVHFFKAFGSMEGVESNEEEEVEIHDVWDTRTYDDSEMIPNLHWLIPLALDNVFAGTIREELMLDEDKANP